MENYKKNTRNGLRIRGRIAGPPPKTRTFEDSFTKRVRQKRTKHVGRQPRLRIAVFIRAAEHVDIVKRREKYATVRFQTRIVIAVAADRACCTYVRPA